MEKVFNRATLNFMTPDAYAEWSERMEEAAFMRQPRQGEVTAPMVIRDGQGGINGLQSMADGKFYDSKRALRKHYREAGVIEVGNDGASERGKAPKDPKAKEKRMDAIGKAFNRAGLPTT